jgi:hypothetical protein
MQLRGIKDKIKELYIQGYNSNEIVKTINSLNRNKKTTKAAVQKYIQRNFKDLKLQHERATIVRKETLKAIDYESKKYMTDKAFILKNRSIYETKKNGDIVVKKGINITWDTPKRLVNENKVK